MINFFTQLDARILELINQTWRSEHLNDLIAKFSSDDLYIGVGVGIVITYFILIGKKGSRPFLLAALTLALAVGTTDQLSNITKRLTAKPRPYHSRPGVFYQDQGKWVQNPPHFMAEKARNFSFFSAHASNSMSCATVISTIYPPAAPLVYGFSFIVGYSRVYTGKHYPSDVLAGWIIGYCVGRLYARLYTRLRKRCCTKAQLNA